MHKNTRKQTHIYSSVTFRNKIYMPALSNINEDEWEIGLNYSLKDPKIKTKAFISIFIFIYHIYVDLQKGGGKE